jgi:hypothetical protein
VELAAALLTAAAADRIYPDAASRQAGDVDPGRWSVRPAVFCGIAPTRGPLVTTWLAEEQRAKPARNRQQGFFGPLNDRELTILRMLSAPTSLRELATDLFITSSPGSDVTQFVSTLTRPSPSPRTRSSTPYR